MLRKIELFVRLLSRKVGRLLIGGEESNWRSSLSAKASGIVLCMAIAAAPTITLAQNVTFKVPPVKIPLKIKNSR